MKMFKLLIDMLFINNIGAQMLVGGTRDDHGCVMDGGYTWCEETQSCIRPWETECNTLVVTEPGPVIDQPSVCHECAPPMPCPEPYIPEFNNNNCILNNNVDECGCQTSCPSYDCSEVVIPKNCATWYDGCNTCQVRDGRAEICTLMYCFRQSESYCMTFHIQKNTLNTGDICYRFCEDGSQEFINRRSDCPDGTTCKKINLFGNNIGYDSCGDNAYRCLEDSSH